MNYRPNAQLGYTWQITADPAKDVQVFDEVAAVIDQGGRRPTGWMRRFAAQQGAVTFTPIGQTPKYQGRTCCFVHLAAFETRGDLRPGLDTKCPECGREFKLVLEVRSDRR